MRGGARIQTSSATAAVTGSAHPTIDARNQERGGAGNVVRAMAASIAWHRAQLAACASMAARSRRLSVSSAHAASVSGSRQWGESPDIRAWSASRSSRLDISLINDLLQIERTRIVGD